MKTLIKPFEKSSCLSCKRTKKKSSVTLQIFKHAIFHSSQIAIYNLIQRNTTICWEGNFDNKKLGHVCRNRLGSNTENKI